MFNLRMLLIATGLTVLLAITNTYLALKVGLLTAASIPAAMISMTLLQRSTKDLWHQQNYIQTAASSGEAIAGGIGYTLPALVLLGYWHNIHYWPAFFVALGGGMLGILFTMFFRKNLLSEPTLRFPEAVAITSVIKNVQEERGGLRYLVYGALVSAVMDLLQNLKIVVSGLYGFIGKSSLFSQVGIGLSPALIGAGYIIGFETGLGLLIGAVLANIVLLPIMSYIGHYSGQPIDIYHAHLSMSLSMIGIGAMLVAALIMIGSSFWLFIKGQKHPASMASPQVPAFFSWFYRKESLAVYLLVFTVLAIWSYESPSLLPRHILVYTLYLLAFGFFIAKVCGYFSGLVGVSASPGSSMLIASLILAVLISQFVFKRGALVGEVMAIIMASIITQIACIANDSIQDLKVGSMLGTNPKKQMLMLMLGVLLAAFVVPWVMQLLIASLGMMHGAFGQGLAAPPAAMMVALASLMYQHDISYSLLYISISIVVIIKILQHLVPGILKPVPLISIGMGIYLPLSLTTPLMLGALIAYITKRHAAKLSTQEQESSSQRKLLFSCGLITGASLMDILIVVPITMSEGHALSMHLPIWGIVALSAMAGLTLLFFFLKPPMKANP